MKNLLLGALCFICVSSCKKQLSGRQYEQIVPVVANDKNFQVSSFKGQAQGAAIKINFTLSLEKDIAEVVLMHGSNPNQLCMVKAVGTNGNSSVQQTYSVIDDVPMSNPTYYILKYVTTGGEWGCSQVYSVNL